MAVHSGVELGQDQSMDDLTLLEVDGDLDVDLAELSLGQRLTALSGVDEIAGQNTMSDSDDEVTSRQSGKQTNKQVPIVVPANSLTRTLIQALHSSDSRLLETCLAHSDQVLIRNTVRRLPPQLAVPLLTACVERLGRGSRAANMKGGGGGASSQRGTGLLAWVKAVLAVHSGHLMTVSSTDLVHNCFDRVSTQMPDLVARLSGLHATLTTRLTLQDSLLSLSGRLDMVLSQIEMRSSAAPAPLALQKGKVLRNAQGKPEPGKYIEGESEDEENVQMEVEVETESDDDAGSIEDVELGGESQEEDEDEDEEDGDEEDDSDDEGPALNGFIDDEAEEADSDEDDESE
jgi:U3 small nucleolar RNA-associated protein 5